MATKRKQKISVDEMVRELSHEVISTRPMPKGKGAPEARCLDAMDRGEALAAIKNFTFDGQVLKVGDSFSPDPKFRARIAQMATHAFVLPASEYQAAQKNHHLHSFYRNVIEPEKSLLERQRRNVREAREQVGELTIRLHDAQTALSDAEGREKLQTEKLEELLNGPDAEKLFSD